MPPPAVDRARFTLDGDDALEDHLATTCDRIRAGLSGLLPAGKLEAVLLGGGYGRGEGGVLRTGDGDRPYNDLEFYVFLRGNRHLNEPLHGRALHVLAEILTPQAGIEVEFRITSRAELEAADVSMFSYDLVSGHRRVLGDRSFLDACEHHRVAEDIPLAEATRLLMNRCSGLLFAQERLARRHFTAADADFVARNIAKAELGAGDAVLTAQRGYHWSVVERHRRLERLRRTDHAAWLSDVARHHASGVDFKLHPTRSTDSREALAQRHAVVADLCRVVWLWLESRRLRTGFRSIQDYADAPVKCPEASGPRNLLVNAKLFGPRGLAVASPLRHPREHVLTALPLLLWQPDVTTSPALLGRIQRLLRTTATAPAGLVAAYQALWSRLN